MSPHQQPQQWSAMTIPTGSATSYVHFSGGIPGQQNPPPPEECNNMKSPEANWVDQNRALRDSIFTMSPPGSIEPADPSPESVVEFSFDFMIDFRDHCAHPTRITLHLIRSAEANRNFQGISPAEVQDPEISLKALQQCHSLQQSMSQLMPNLTHIVTSPMTRAIQTAEAVFRPLLQRGMKAVACRLLKDHSQVSHKANDMTMLAGRWQHLGFDFSELPPGWQTMPCSDFPGMDAKEGLWKLTTWALEVGQTNTHGNIEVAVVTHGNLLKDMEGGDEVIGHAAYKSYQFWCECDRARHDFTLEPWSTILETSESLVRGNSIGATIGELS